jgi:hypothetical protein
MFKEINNRESNGISVTLSWNDSAKDRPEEPQFLVEVSDVKENQNFTLSLDCFDDAKEAYYHPFGVANRYLKSGKVAA